MYSKLLQILHKYFNIILLGMISLTFLLMILFGDWKKTSNNAENMNQASVFCDPLVDYIELIQNVCLLNLGQDGLDVYYNGETKHYLYQENYSLNHTMQGKNQVLADIVLRNNRVVDCHVIQDKIKGEIVAVTNDALYLSNGESYPLDRGIRGYETYHIVKDCDIRKIPYGYDYTEFYIEDGCVKGFFVTSNQEMSNIRVVICDPNGSLFHKNVELNINGGGKITYFNKNLGKKEEIIEDKRLFVDNYDEAWYMAVVEPNDLNGTIMFACDGNQRYYSGTMNLFKDKDGIVVVNELPLETYLYSVVPSEMPSSYPKEALMAQAICARTYAYGKMRNAQYPEYGGHLDDTTRNQVYNKVPVQLSTTEAVRETYGMVLLKNQDIPELYYYSTSCGLGTDDNIWKISKNSDFQSQMAFSESFEDGFADYIKGKNQDDFEINEKYYRWQCINPKLGVEDIFQKLCDIKQKNSNMICCLDSKGREDESFISFNHIKDMQVKSRGTGGVALEFWIETDTCIYKIYSEYYIRYLLGSQSEASLIFGDNTTSNQFTLLPSAFFVLETSKNKGNVVGYTISGGGYGHGVGMSQNGAKNMALKGYSCEEILKKYYEGFNLEYLYEPSDIK